METINDFIAWAIALFASLCAWFFFNKKVDAVRLDLPPPVPETPLKPVEAPVEPVKLPVKEMPVLSWETQRGAFKLTRIMADEIGLTLEQKNDLCASIYQESQFRNHLPNGKPVINQNKDKATGKVWSTDYGIVQVNDWYHIGKGKTYPSVEYVMNNPDKMVRWMAMTLKRTGKLQPWASYTSGAFKQWLVPTSRMWLLKS